MIFIGICVITSQLFIALSSIGLVGTIILYLSLLILRKKIFVADKKIYILLGLFILVQIISGIFSDHSSDSFTNFYRHASLSLIFLTAVDVFSSKKHLKVLLIIFFIFTSLLSCYELYLYIIEHFKHTEIPLSELRIEYFGYPVTNGGIKMMILLMMIPFLFIKEKFLLNKVLLIIISLPIFVSMYFTNSRSAFVGLFFALIIFGILKNKIFLFSFLIVLTAGLIFLPKEYTERVYSIADVNHGSNKARFIIWETGIKMHHAKPFLGYGDIDLNEAYRKFRTPEIHGEGTHMHNNIIHILVIFGLVGLLSWLALMFTIFIRQIKIFFKTKSDLFLNSIALSSMLCMIAFQLSGLFEWNFGDVEVVSVFWFIISLSFIANKLSAQNVP